MRTRKVPAVTRAVALLRHLGGAEVPLGVNQLARELRLVPSTCLHILRVLVDEGLVTFDPATKRYALGVGIVPIAQAALRRNSVAPLVDPWLSKLSKSFGGTAIATQLTDAEHMLVVALSRSQQPFRLQVDLGSRFPALISASGRCHAAFNCHDLSDTQLKARFTRLKWDHPPSFQDWHADVARTRSDGFAVDRGSYISGVTIIAVPIFDGDGRMTHSIVFIDISERLDAVGIRAIAKEMMTARDAVSSGTIAAMV